MTAINTTYEFMVPGTNVRAQTWSPEVRRYLPDGRIDRSFGPASGLHDPVYPTNPPATEEDLSHNGFSVSAGGAIAVCGGDRRSFEPGHKPDYDSIGFIQVFDPATAADPLAPAGNVLRGDVGNPIEDCAWQSDGKLLAVDLHGTLTVGRYQ